MLPGRESSIKTELFSRTDSPDTYGRGTSKRKSLITATHKKSETGVQPASKDPATAVDQAELSMFDKA